MGAGSLFSFFCLSLRHGSVDSLVACWLVTARFTRFQRDTKGAVSVSEVAEGECGQDDGDCELSDMCESEGSDCEGDADDESGGDNVAGDSEDGDR